MASMILPAIFGGLGKILGGGSEAKAQQREAQANAARDQEYLRQTQERSYFDAMLQREMQRREAMDQGWRRTLNADTISNFDAEKNKAQGLYQTPYYRPIQGPGAGAKAAATDPMMAEMLKRMTTGQYDVYGGQLPNRAPDFTTWNKALKPGKLEQILGWAGLGSGTVGEILSGIERSRQQPSGPTTIPIH